MRPHAKGVILIVRMSGGNEERRLVERSLYVTKLFDDMQASIGTRSLARAPYPFDVQAGRGALKESTHVLLMVQPSSLPTNEISEKWIPFRRYRGKSHALIKRSRRSR